MKSVFLLILACVSALAVAQATTEPSAAPSTKSAATKRYPTPTELIEKMKARRAAELAVPKIAYFDLSRQLTEKPGDFSFWDLEDSTTLRSLLERLQKASEDKSIRAVLITLGDASPSFAQAQEIRDALLKINKSGKQTFVYADSYDTVGYTLASGASHICMLEAGEIMIPGVALEATFARGLLDKIGVKADAIQIGEYKGADEEFTRTEASDELKGELNKLTQSLYDEIVNGISLNRNISKAEVRRLIDDCIVRGRIAKERGLVDHLVDQDGLRSLIKSETNEKEIETVANYGRDDREIPDLSNPWSVLAMMTKRPDSENSGKPAIALVYVDGMIVDGEGSDGLFSSAVGSHDIRKALRTATRDSDIKAIVIRIDSPGGSALASEVMWQATHRAAESKPVIISIGSMAASGGYYLASAGDTIFADPSAIVGSIGVVGGKFVVRDLFAKIGLNAQSFSRGRNADLFSSQTPFDDRQRKLITQWMRQTYEQFTDRVQSGRGTKIKDIDAVARGRIFLARQAKDLGLVDELGGTSDAIAHAARKADLKPGQYELRILPAPKTLADYLGFTSETRSPIRPSITLSPDSILRTLSPTLSRALTSQLQTLLLLQDHPVMLVMPATIQVR